MIEYSTGSEITDQAVALLGFLTSESLHGYEIHRRLSSPDAAGMVWHVRRSNLYAMLDKLEAVGWLTSQVEPADPRPPRKRFSITPAGRQIFERWLQTPVLHPRDIRQVFLLKLYFAQRTSPTATRTLVAAQLTRSQQWLTSQLEQREPFAAAVAAYRTHQIRAIHQWLTDLLTTLPEA